MNIDRKRPERRLKKELKELREYVPSLWEIGRPESLRRDIAADLARGEPHVVVDLGLLASYMGAHGCLRVVEGDHDGFTEIDRALLYEFWSIRLRTISYDLDPCSDADKQRRSTMMDGIATAWMHTEAIGAVGLRTWLDGLLLRADRGYQGVRYRDMSPLCTLVGHFVTGKDAAALEASGWGDIGPYAPIVDGSFDASQWDALATWHIDSISTSGFPAFKNFPYSLIPFELMAISRRTGIPISGDSPLFHTVLAARREVPEIPVTEELQAILDCARKVYGDI